MLDSATIVGLGGEIEAGIRAPFSDKTFKRSTAKSIKQQAAFKENYPAEYTRNILVVWACCQQLAVGAPAAVTRVVGGKVLPNVALGTGTGGFGWFS